MSTRKVANDIASGPVPNDITDNSIDHANGVAGAAAETDDAQAQAAASNPLAAFAASAAAVDKANPLAAFAANASGKGTGKGLKGMNMNAMMMKGKGKDGKGKGSDGWGKGSDWATGKGSDGWGTDAWIGDWWGAGKGKGKDGGWSGGKGEWAVWDPSTAGVGYGEFLIRCDVFSGGV